MVSQDPSVVEPPIGVTPDAAFQGRRTLATGALWLLSSNIAYAACQWGTLVALAKLGSAASLGHFGLALAVATPVVLVTGFALRALQATDVMRRYAFADYFNLRMAANLVAAAIIGMAALAAVDEAAAAILVPMGLAKLVEATSETCYGLAQRHDQMRFVALSKMFRGSLGLAALVAVVALGGTVALGAWALAATWTAFLLAVDLRAAGALEPILARPRLATLKRLAGESIPLGAVNGIAALTQSLPRYLLQSSTGAAAVGYFTALSSVGPALEQFSGSIGHAAAPRLGWAVSRDSRTFRALVLRLLATATGIGALLAAGAAIGGHAFLGFAYTRDYAAYERAFVIVVIAAGFALLNSMAFFAFVAARRPVLQLVIRLLGLVATGIAGVALIPRFGVDGAAVALAVGGGVMAVVSAAALLFGLSAAADRSSESPSTETTEPWARNLLHTFDELLDHLRTSASGSEHRQERPKAMLADAYLTACALSQVLDDFLHRGSLGLTARLEAAASRPEKLDSVVFLPASVIAALRPLISAAPVRMVARLLDAIATARMRMRFLVRERRLAACSRLFHRAACDLASLYASADGETGRGSDAVDRLLNEVAAYAFPPSLRQSVLKIPSCFKDFDCHPDDCAELVRRFAARAEDRTRPVTIVGIRTSGSYLAPLCVAHLRLLGFEDVEMATMRPKVPLLPYERAAVARRGRAGSVLVVDDPPVTGGTFRSVTRAVTRIGIPNSHIFALLLEEPGVPFTRDPNRYGDLNPIVLRRPEWRITKTLEAVGPVSLPRRNGTAGSERTSRCHAKVCFARELAAGEHATFLAKGVGFGWFEDHVRQAASGLQGFVPPAFMQAEGVLVTRWADGPTLADRPDACDPAFVRHVARYVAARLRELPIRTGSSNGAHRETGWDVLARCFGRSYSVLAPLSYDRLRRQLARVGSSARGAQVDGRMGPREWIVRADDGVPLKVDFEEHAFDRLGVGILDPVFDLAGFVVENGLSRELEDVLVREYAQLTRDDAAGRRLPCYKLMVGLAKEDELRRLLLYGGSISQGFDGCDPKEVAIRKTQLERSLAHVANDFLARHFAPTGTTRAPEGKLFAIDIDGVLEDSVLGFSATTPAGALALRTLQRHGFSPVLASGRSLAEVRDRCRSFGLVAGIAEYGSVIWVDGARAEIRLASRAEMEELDHLRAVLAQEEDIIVDSAYRHSVRVFQYRRGRRGAVPVDRVTVVLRKEGLKRLRVVAGEDQIDVVGKNCNKGRAARLLKRKLSARELHAAGDTVEDLPMLDLADRAYAPRNVERRAESRLDGRLFVATRKRQQGLLEIARRAAHGVNRACPSCPAADGDGDAALLSAFGIRDRSPLARVVQLFAPASDR